MKNIMEKKPKGWFRRHKIITGILAGFIFVIFLAALSPTPPEATKAPAKTEAKAPETLKSTTTPPEATKAPETTKTPTKAIKAPEATTPPKKTEAKVLAPAKAPAKAPKKFVARIIKISATKLFDESLLNRYKAQSDYLDYKLLISGKVLEVVPTNGHPAVLLSAGIAKSAVACILSSSASDEKSISNIEAGESIHVLGHWQKIIQKDAFYFLYIDPCEIK